MIKSCYENNLASSILLLLILTIFFKVMSPRLASVPISVAGTLTMEVTSMLGLEFHQPVATAFLS